MQVQATTDQSTTLDVGDVWELGVVALDDDGYPTSATVSVSVTTPGGGSASPTAVEDETGFYMASYTTAAAGRHLAVVTVSGEVVGVVPFTAWAGTPTAAAGMPDLTEVKAYLGETSVADDQITAALSAESSAQRARCSVPASYPADLREALLRRVARNLAARSVPVASFSSFEGGGTVTQVPMHDPEIVRLEAPYRRRRVG